MSPDPEDIQPLLDRLRGGDATAVALLAEVAYDRLRRLAGKMLSQSFAPVGRVHDLDSVLNTTYVRLHDALTKMAAEAKTPPTPADFFRFAAFKIRHVLFDMVNKDRRQRAVQKAFEWDREDSGWVPPAWWEDKGPSPDRQADWVEFLERVDRLPELDRDVFQMHVVMAMTQAQIAKELNLEPKQVSRAWLKAAAAVGKYLPA